MPRVSAPRTELQVGVPSEPVDGVVCSSIIKLLYDICEPSSEGDWTCGLCSLKL